MMSERATEVESSFTPHESLLKGAYGETKAIANTSGLSIETVYGHGLWRQYDAEFGTCTVGANPRVPARHRRDGAMWSGGSTHEVASIRDRASALVGWGANGFHGERKQG